jgi:demethylmenaquinone methyltransferase / 2-methoxy-6-polyprenyl-1,4-benzoquinol methylase
VANKYLSYDAARSPKVRAMFSRVAWRYDILNDLMSLGLHRRWKRQTVAVALEGKTGRSPRVLDLCCGSGDLGFLAEAAGAGVVIGADFTLPMLAVARRRRAREGRRAVFVQADALDLPFADGVFDAVTIGYGLRNVADIEKALAEMRRVLVPGGRAAVLDFGKPESAAVGALYRGFLRAAMPVVGWLFHGDPDTYRYIPESLERYPAQRGVEALMRQAGFADVGFANRMLGTMGINAGRRP